MPFTGLEEREKRKGEFGSVAKKGNHGVSFGERGLCTYIYRTLLGMCHLCKEGHYFAAAASSFC